MIRNKRTHEVGAINRQLIIIVALSVLFLAALGLAIWGIVNYNQQKTNVDIKIDSAVATAEKNQSDADEAKFAAREKDPNREFLGPSDYGSLTFSYPKTWSVYIAQDGSNGDSYEAYLNPVTVPPVSDSTQFALRVTIENTDYDQVIADNNNAVQDGDLTASPVTAANGVSGTRLDGKLSDTIRGSEVIFKIRATTLIIRTDADTFDPDFNALIATIKFNQ